MKNRTSIIVAALLTILVAGCSKHSPPAPKVADLGIVEVTEDGKNHRVTSNDGRVFVVRSVIIKDYKATINGKESVIKGPIINLMISQELTDSHGVTHLTHEQNVGADPGQTVGISDGVTSISITPKIKP